MTNYYKSPNEIEAVVRGFETCFLGKDEFPQQSHLTVAVSYLTNSDFDQATQKMRSGLFSFLDHHGVGRQKYSETLTMFWMKMVSKVIRQLPADSSLLEITNSVVERLSPSGLVFEYYSRELLLSEEARSSWVEPDLRKFD